MHGNNKDLTSQHRQCERNANMKIQLTLFATDNGNQTYARQVASFFQVKGQKKSIGANWLVR